MPSRLLSDFVATLPREQIEMKLAERSRQVNLSCARNTASVGGMDPDDFPPIPPVAEDRTVHVDAERLRTAINQTVFSAATDDSRPVLTGVHFAMKGKQLRLAAADGFRLSVHTMELNDEAEDRAVIVPARALGELGRLLAEAGENVVAITFNAAHTQVQFDLGHAKLIAQLIQGSFPNYEQLIPSSTGTHTEVGVAEFLRETRIASIFARDGSGIVRLQFTAGEDLNPGKIVISARAEEIGDNMGELDATIEGEPDKIAFNSRYLQDFLQVVGEGRVALEMNGASRQGVLRPVSDERYVHVLMPMVVQW
jgi:DNA polymerase-3 subunit beta